MINDNIIEEIGRENSNADIYNLCCNQDEVVNIISFFRELGLTCINDLLIYRINVFFQSLDDVKNKFSINNASDIVKSINDDYTNIDEL